MELSKTMKPMAERQSVIEDERRDILKKKQQEKEAEEFKECTFKPIRVCATKSDKYLKKIGRTDPVAPDDFFNYKKYQDSRNFQV